MINADGKRLIVFLFVILATQNTICIAAECTQYRRFCYTRWLNFDSPGGSGDFEYLSNFEATLACPRPVCIQCQDRLTFRPYNTTGDVFLNPCEPHIGLVCLNAAQPLFSFCNDYRVRFLCPEGTIQDLRGAVCLDYCESELFNYVSSSGRCDYPVDDCGPLSDPPNGRVRMNEMGVTSIANYSCNTGYQPAGDTTVVCMNDGTWSDTPSCQLVDCGSLSAPDNGQVISNGTEYNSTAHYVCDAGFIPVNNGTIVCQENGTWSNSPICQPVDCGSLAGPANGQVTLSGSGFGSTASYICSSGHGLVGNFSRICTKNGNWSGDEPHCVLDPPGNSQGAIIGSVVSVSVILLVLLALMIAAGCCIMTKYRKRTSPKTQVSENDHELINISALVHEFRGSKQESALIHTQIQEVVEMIPLSSRIPRTQLQMSSTSIGQGEFGIVYKGILLNWNNIPVQGVAVKALKGLFTLSDVHSLVNEIIKMKEFHHPHVMPLIGVCLDAGPGVSIVMPYMTNGSLLDYLKKERNNMELNNNDTNKALVVRKLLLRMCHQIALGMKYLMEQKFIHRDLAARNCMLDNNGNIKVGDFGMAEDVYNSGYFRQEGMQKIKLPYKWMALESLTDCIFSEKTDVWSYGVTMWELFSGGENPYPAVDPMTLPQLLKDGKRLESPENVVCSPEIFAVMARCWCADPKERPDFIELCSIMDQFLGLISEYTELRMELVEDQFGPEILDNDDEQSIQKRKSHDH